MAQPITDVYVYLRKPWRCPDCNVIHRGECPNKAMQLLYAYEQRLSVVENEVAQQSEYLESLKPFLEEMGQAIRVLRNEVRKLRKELRVCTTKPRHT